MAYWIVDVLVDLKTFAEEENIPEELTNKLSETLLTAQKHFPPINSGQLIPRKAKEQRKRQGDPVG